MRRLPRRLARHREQRASKSGSIRASCGAATPGTSRSAGKSRLAPYSSRSPPGTTNERDEGHFRLEGKLAVDRSHLISANRAFLLPVVIDDTRDNDEQVPDRIRDVQWTRLPGGDTPSAFVERVRRLRLRPR
jgi:hypothetical protein